MRVTCNSIEEFIENLQQIQDNEVLNRVVYFSVNKRWLTDDKSKQQISVQASTVVELVSGVQYLLDSGEDCGRDLLTSDKDVSGSNRAEELKQQLQEICKKNNWKILPGVCSE